MLHELIDFLYPAQCAGCNTLGSGLCERCVPHARTIARTLPTLHVRALGEYEGALRRAVLALKDGRRDVAEAFGSRLASFLSGEAMLIPVPTTAARRRVRGFDGVTSVATVAARLSGGSVCTALTMLRADAQRGRGREARLLGRGRFTASALLEGAVVTLVDDVCTTGATLEDCAQALRSAGAIVTQAFVVASANGGA